MTAYPDTCPGGFSRWIPHYLRTANTAVTAAVVNTCAHGELELSFTFTFTLAFCEVSSSVVSEYGLDVAQFMDGGGLTGSACVDSPDCIRWGVICLEGVCTCIPRLGMQGLYCNEVTPSAAWSIASLSLSVVLYAVNFVYLLHVCIKLFCTRDVWVSTSRWVMVLVVASSVMYALEAAADLVLLAGKTPKLMDALADLLLTPNAITMQIVALLLLSIDWIDIAIATERLTTRSRHRLMRVKRFIWCGSAVYWIIVQALVGCVVHALVLPSFTPVKQVVRDSLDEQFQTCDLVRNSILLLVIPVIMITFQVGAKRMLRLGVRHVDGIALDVAGTPPDTGCAEGIRGKAVACVRRRFFDPPPLPGPPSTVLGPKLIPLVAVTANRVTLSLGLVLVSFALRVALLGAESSLGIGPAWIAYTCLTLANVAVLTSVAAFVSKDHEAHMACRPPTSPVLNCGTSSCSSMNSSGASGDAIASPMGR